MAVQKMNRSGLVCFSAAFCWTGEPENEDFGPSAVVYFYDNSGKTGWITRINTNEDEALFATPVLRQTLSKTCRLPFVILIAACSAACLSHSDSFPKTFNSHFRFHFYFAPTPRIPRATHTLNAHSKTHE